MGRCLSNPDPPRRGDEINDALQAYFTDHGEYPAGLAPLVPTYLPTIQPPVAGNGQWTYRRYADDAYSLGFTGDYDRSYDVWWKPGYTDWFVDTQ